MIFQSKSFYLIKYYLILKGLFNNNIPIFSTLYTKNWQIVMIKRKKPEYQDYRIQQKSQGAQSAPEKIELLKTTIKISQSLFIIDAKFKEGGFSNVYRVTKIIRQQGDQIIYGQSYALKVINLRKGISEQELKMISIEKMLLLSPSLAHKNIIKVYDVVLSEQKQALLILTELAEHLTLRDIIYQRSLQPKQIVHIFKQVCQGINHLHQHKILHRDIKKSNICFVKVQNFIKSFEYQPEKFIVKIIDFGISNYQQDISLDDTSGTAAYLSPQLLQGKTQSDASDIWALGVLLYQMITNGENPFEGNNNLETYNKIKNEEYKSHPILKEFQFVHLGKLVEKILQKNPKNRPKLQEILKQLQQFQKPLKAENTQEVFFTRQSFFHSSLVLRNSQFYRKTDLDYWKRENKIRIIKSENVKELFVDRFFITLEQDQISFLTIDCILHYCFRDRSEIIVDCSQMFDQQLNCSFQKIVWKGYMKKVDETQFSSISSDSDRLQYQKRNLIKFQIHSTSQRIITLKQFLSKQQGKKNKKQKKQKRQYPIYTHHFQKTIQYQGVFLSNDIVQLDFRDLSTLILMMKTKQIFYMNQEVNSKISFAQFKEISQKYLKGQYSQDQLIYAEQLHKKYNRIKSIIINSLQQPSE